MTTAIEPTAAIANAQDALARAIANRTSLEQRLAAARASVEPLGADIANAMAAGDETKASALREKRERAQAEIPDLTRAVAIASRSAEDADRDLARLQLAPLVAELEESCRRFVGLIAQANALTSGIKVQMSRVSSCLSRADVSDDPAHDPRSARKILGRVLTPLARRIFGELRDYTAD